MPIKRRNPKTGKDEVFGRVSLPDGRRKEKKCATRREAVAWEVLIRQKLKECSLDRTPIVSLHTLMTKHLDALVAKGISEGTVADKRLVFQALLAFPGVSPVMGARDLHHDLVRRFLDGVAADKSGHRANTYRKHLLRLWSWAKRSRMVQGECPWDVERYKEERQDKYVPPEADFWAVVREAEKVPTSYSKKYGHFERQPHRRRMMLAFLHLAARKGEVFGLRWTDVDFEGRRVRLWTRKRDGGLEFDWVPMTEELAETLLEQRLETGFADRVFVNPTTGKGYTSASKMMGKMCKAAKVKPFGFHAIRHLSASILAKAGVDLPTIQLILRHRSITTTSRYVHSLTDASRAVNRAFGGKVVEMKTATSDGLVAVKR
ncbi:MAG: tyrosine-type recombinase/integrase [Desulfovibrionaceae bacterium]